MPSNRLWKKGLVIGVTCLLMLVSIPLVSAGENLYSIINEVKKECNEYTKHGYICINGNSDFTPENGVVSGNGTKEDPYIISGWEFDGHFQYILDKIRFSFGIFTRILIYYYYGEVESALLIENTNRYVVIRDNIFERWVEPQPPIVLPDYDGPNHNAIMLINTENIIIQNNIIKGCNFGITCENSNIIIENNIINECNEGITCTTSNVIIRNNSLESINGGEFIILLEKQMYTMVEYNSFRSCNSECGIYAHYAEDDMIIQNNVFQKIDSIVTISVTSNNKPVNVRNNILQECNHYGIGGANGLIENNTLEDCNLAIWRIENSIVRNNLICSSDIAIIPGSSCEISNNDIIDNEIGIGCYWPWEYSPIIVNNVFRGNYKAFYCKENTDPVVHFNNIYDNEYGIAYHGGKIINATWNWWGAANGPSESGSGDGDTVSPDVAYEPWLTEPNPDAGRQ